MNKHSQNSNSKDRGMIAFLSFVQILGLVVSIPMAIGSVFIFSLPSIYPDHVPSFDPEYLAFRIISVSLIPLLLAAWAQGFKYRLINGEK